MRAKYILSLILLTVMVLASCSAAGNGEEEQPQSTTAEQALVVDTEMISTREEALDALRSIGMTVFEEPVDAPQFNTTTLEGTQVSLSDYEGKVIFLNFWATWCGPCRIEMPSMEGLHQDLADEDFVILAVNQAEDTDIVQQFMNEEGYSFPVLMDDGTIGFQYGVRGIPTTYIIGPEGNVLAGKVGTHIYDGSIYRDMFRQLM